MYFDSAGLCPVAKFGMKCDRGSASVGWLFLLSVCSYWFLLVFC